MATVEPEELEDFADVIFVGEADTTFSPIPPGMGGRTSWHAYVQADKTDMTTLPQPRLDLLKSQHYMFGSMQISRLPLHLRVLRYHRHLRSQTRLKSSRQILAELDAYYRTGIRIVFVVDDNLIGNKKAIKPILRDIIQWQEEPCLRAYFVHRSVA